MNLRNASRFSATIGIFALLITIFIASDAAAQCSCYTRHARHVAHSRARRTHTRVVTVVRPVYKTVYVPSTRVASYVGYANDYTPATRVVVTDSYNSLNGVASGWGHRDGFKDGWKAALKGRRYNPENNHDFRDADNGYKRRFGSKYLYKASYREGYVRGYEVGYRSVAGGEMYGSIRY